jgi:hypothetical protein
MLEPSMGSGAGRAARRNLFCSCTPILGFLLLPKCPLCVVAGLAAIGIAARLSRTVLVLSLQAIPIAALFAAAWRAKRLAPVVAGAGAAGLILAGQMAGVVTLYVAHQH